LSAATKWVLPPADRKLDDLVREYGRDHARAKLVSGQWTAFWCNRNTGDLKQIPAIIWDRPPWGIWLDDWIEPLPGPKFGIAEYAVVVQVLEPPPQRKAPQTDRIKQAITKRFPNGTDGISTKVIHDAVVKELAPDSKKKGLADPSETSVKRALGRRK
jgi:hypothetical protein